MPEQGVEIEVIWPTEYEASPTNAFRASRVQDHVEVMWGYLPVSVVTGMIHGHVAPGPITVRRVQAGHMSAKSFQEFFKHMRTMHDALVAAGLIEDLSGNNPEEDKE